MTGYVFTSESHGAFAPEGRVTMTADQVAAHNGALEAAELEAWASAPEHAAAYFKSGDTSQHSVTTWRGTRLGWVVNFRQYRGGFGRSLMTSIRVRGSNGALYSGRFGSFDLVRLRRIKG